MAQGEKGKDAGRKRGAGSKWQLPSGSWRVQFYVDGEPVRETHPTESAANARLEEIRRLAEQHYDIGSGLQDVTTFLTSWLEQRRRSSRADRTLDADKRNVEAYIVPSIGTKRLADVRAQHLQSLLNSIEDDVRERSGGRYGGTRTAQLVATLLTQSFEAAVKQRIIPFSPMDGVQIPTYERAEIEPADDAQVAALLIAAAKVPMPALWYAYALLGLRRGEALGWRVSDLDLKGRTVKVGQQVQAVGGELRLVPPKRGSARTLPLPKMIVPWLEERLTQQKRERLEAGPAWHDLDLVFCRPAGQPIWPSTVSHWWYDLRDAARFPKHLTLHSLRHSFTTMLDETMITETMKMSILGHGKKTVTQKYTHPRVEAMRRPIEEVAERLGRAMERVREAVA